ncbi:MAG: dihydroorotase, partial [Rikenellaceae bacterium]
NGTIVNENREEQGSIIVRDELIEKIVFGEFQGDEDIYDKVIDASGCIVAPGVIDDQVHFREPGLTYKAEIATESAAAVAGGVTSYMEMPNTNPPTTTLEALNDKFNRASEVSLANYSFYFGANNSNYNLFEKLDTRRVCGVKVFMGSSTGDMLVDKKEALEAIFRESPILVATHCEAEEIIRANMAHYKAMYPNNDAPTSIHPLIRSAEACYVSSARAVELATKYNTKLHILHLSTAREMELLSNKPLSEKRITGEVCVHHLWFDDGDYAMKGNLIKWNPAIKTSADREALREALNNGKLDVVATDHAPHTLEEKMRPYFDAPSGGPMVQHSLLAMLQMEKLFKTTDVITKMCHAPAQLYGVVKRGYLRECYFADIVIVKKATPFTVESSNIVSKCRWSPMEGYTFRNKIAYTIVNGNIVYNHGIISAENSGRELIFT